MDNTIHYRNFIVTYQKAYCSSGSKDKILRAGQRERNKVKSLSSNVYNDQLAKLTAMPTKLKANLRQMWANTEVKNLMQNSFNPQRNSEA